MKKIWFKRKTYGFGWTPSTIEGWLTIAVYAMLLVLIFCILGKDSSSETQMITDHAFVVIVLTALLIVVCYIKGETPRWQWGKKDDVQKDK
jgi:hypothetical protein